MFVYLTAGTNETFDVSAYTYKVANFPVTSDKRWGWTVVEAHLHGLLELSNFIIKKMLYRSVQEFVVCTSSSLIQKICDTDYLYDLQKNSWKSPDGAPLFHVPLLKELYYHKLFYKERDVSWSILMELGETEYRQYDLCTDRLKQIL